MRRLMAAGLTGLLLVAGTAPVCMAATLSQYQSQEQTVAVQLSAAQNEYDLAMQAWNDALTALGRAETALRSGAAHLKSLTVQTTQAQADLAQRQQAVAAQKVVVAQDQGKADQGLLTIDENGTVPFLGVLLGANSFGDFLTRLSMLQKIWAMEVGFLRAAQAAQAQLQTLERAQRQEVDHLSSLKQQAANQVGVLQAQEQTAQTAKAAEDTAVQTAQNIVGKLAAERNGLQAKIQAILAAIQSGKASWSQILGLIQQLSAQYGISPALVEAVVLQESGGDSKAVSSAGAQGLMQLMPATAAALGVSNAYDPVQNLEGGIKYLIEQLNHFHGNIQLALAAYNAGPGAVEKYGGIPPYTQTQNYVRNIMAMYQAGK